MAVGLLEEVEEAIEPVSVDEAKLFLRLGGVAYDGLVSRLIKSARERLECLLGVAMIERGFTYPAQAGSVVLPRWPVKEVKGHNTRLEARPVRLNLKEPEVLRFTAGYGTEPTDVPAPLRQALLLLVSHGYEHASHAGERPLPLMVQALIAPYRVAT